MSCERDFCAVFLHPQALYFSAQGLSHTSIDKKSDCQSLWDNLIPWVSLMCSEGSYVEYPVPPLVTKHNHLTAS